MRPEWKRPLGLPDQPYAYRWVLPIPFTTLSIRLHRWLGNDDPDALHDHPQWFWTLILKGGYTDVTRASHWEIGAEVPAPESWSHAGPLEREVLTPGSLRFRPAAHMHTVQDVKPGTWTLCLFGGERRNWSFYWYDRGGGWKLRKMSRDWYFKKIGHHTFDGEGRVKLRPDGSRIEP